MASSPSNSDHHQTFVFETLRSQPTLFTFRCIGQWIISKTKAPMKRSQSNTSHPKKPSPKKDSSKFHRNWSLHWMWWHLVELLYLTSWVVQSWQLENKWRENFQCTVSNKNYMTWKVSKNADQHFRKQQISQLNCHFFWKVIQKTPTNSWTFFRAILSDTSIF